MRRSALHAMRWLALMNAPTIGKFDPVTIEIVLEVPKKFAIAR